MSEPRKLSEMVPRCIRADCTKIPRGVVYDHDAGIRISSSGWPLAGEGESPVARWNGVGAVFIINALEDPDGGPFLTDGELGLLITDKALRGTFYEGKGHGAGAAGLRVERRVVTFYWPFAQMNPVRGSFYLNGPRGHHTVIEDPTGDGHLGIPVARRAKGDGQEDFFSGFSMSNKVEEFAEELESARARFVGSTPSQSS